ncbi:MAG: sel1 repeat family protein [Rhodospirillaceae bacterium]|nr:sel1 repeat family protein [Rhodospirillaceae bacterium]
MKLQALGTAVLAGALWVGAVGGARADVEEAMAALQVGDIAQAIEILRVDAEAGDPVAQYQLAAVLASPIGEARDVPEALQWLTQAVQQNHPPALLLSGRFYEIGLGAPQDLELAREAYRAAAEAGVEAASRLLVWDACWQAPTPECLLDMVDEQATDEGFRDPVTGRTIIAVIDWHLRLGTYDRAIELMGQAQTLPLGLEQTERLASLFSDAAEGLAAAGRLDDARQVAEAFADPAARIIPFIRMAGAVAESDAEASEALVADATEAANSLPNDIARADAFTQAAGALIDQGADDLARRMATAAGDALPEATMLTLSEINQVRARLAGVLGQLGDVEAARAMAERAGGTVAPIWYAAAQGLLAAGNTAAVRDLLPEVPDLRLRADVAVALLEQGDEAGDAALVDQVSELLGSLPADLNRTHLVQRLVRALVAAGANDQALDLLGLIDLPLARAQALEGMQSASGDAGLRARIAVALARAAGLSDDDLGDLADSPAAAPDAADIQDLLMAGADVPLFDEGPLVDEMLRLAVRGLARIDDAAAVEAALARFQSDQRRFYARLAAITAAGSTDSPVVDAQMAAALEVAAPVDDLFLSRSLARLAHALVAIDAIDRATATLRRIDDPATFSTGTLELIGHLDAAEG